MTRSLLLVAALAAMTIGGSAQAPSRHVILVTIDGLRGDSISAADFDGVPAARHGILGHGYSPVIPGMETGLIIAGAGVRRGVRLPETRTLDVAPTIAMLLGLELPQAEGQPMAGALK